MIGHLNGRLAECSPGRVLVDVGGVGYDLQIPLSTFYAISPRKGGAVALHVHTHVREDALTLFGFSTLEERSLFEQCIAVNGVGPRLALAVLSGIGVEELWRAVEQEDRERLQRIPGVGRKTAERLLLDLGDRLARRPRERPGAPTGAATASGKAPDDYRTDAVSALVNLGYGREVAERAVERAGSGLEPGAGLEDLLKGSLRALMGMR